MEWQFSCQKSYILPFLQYKFQILNWDQMKNKKPNEKEEEKEKVYSQTKIT